jgi:hypothetical protein
MKKIKDLPTDFFEKIELSTLTCMTDKHVIKSKDYYIFSSDNNFRGIKKSSSEGGIPFFLTHKELFDSACLIYEKMYKSSPEYLYYFHDEAKMWNAFIVSGYDFDTINAYKDGFFENNMPIQVGDTNGFPAIGASNSYEMDENPAFFYVVTSPVDNRNTFLTIDNFRFRRAVDREVLLKAKKNNSFTQWMESFAHDKAETFLAAETKFKKLLKDLSVKEVEPQFFAPIVLDLYNKNRNIQSVKNDVELSRDIYKLYNNANGFVDKGRYYNGINWTIFVSFILRYTNFDLANGTSFPKEKIEELFSTKDSYQKFRDIFSKFINDSERFDQYAKNQLEDWLKLEL